MDEAEGLGEDDPGVLEGLTCEVVAVATDAAEGEEDIAENNDFPAQIVLDISCSDSPLHFLCLITKLSALHNGYAEMR